jgi:hypothetical protein
LALMPGQRFSRTIWQRSRPMRERLAILALNAVTATLRWVTDVLCAWQVRRQDGGDKPLPPPRRKL